MKNAVRNELEILFKHYPELESIRSNIIQVFHNMAHCFRRNGTVYFCGNGGSASDCEHAVGELMKGFKRPRKLTEEEQFVFLQLFAKKGEDIAKNLQKALPAISLVSQTSIATAFNNDVHAEYLFAQLIYGYGKQGDILVGFSTSGTSKNICNAFMAAKVKKLTTIAFTGEKGGELSLISDYCIKVPSTETYRIQEYHLPIYHAVCSMLETEFFGENEDCRLLEEDNFLGISM
ncbi:MAG: SIS domain-containing protein [Dehalobacter sp.]|nr:SIS domain-containing protein [Dehalobacter sp.]